MELHVPDFQRVVLARFVTASGGGPDARYPLLDDRGTRLPPADATAPFHGPLVVMMASQPIVVRLDLEALAHTPLVVESATPGTVELLAVAAAPDAPAITSVLVPRGPGVASGVASLPVPPTGASGNAYVALRQVNDADASPVAIRLRMSATGPVVAQMGVVPRSRVRVRLKPHLVRWDGHAPTFTVTNGNIQVLPSGALGMTLGSRAQGTTSGFDVARVFDGARAIWAAAGIELHVAPADLAPATMSQIHMSGRVANLVGGDGAVTGVFDASIAEWFRVLGNTARTTSAINVFFCQQIFAPGPGTRDAVGFGLPRDVALAEDPGAAARWSGAHGGAAAPQNVRPNAGILVARNGLERSPGGSASPFQSSEMSLTLAHEIGHFFGLLHVADIATPPPSTAAGAPAPPTVSNALRAVIQPGGADIRTAGGETLWQSRRLMYPVLRFSPTAPYRDPRGGSPGGLVWSSYQLSAKRVPHAGETDPAPEWLRARDFIAGLLGGIYDVHNAAGTPL